MRVRIEHRPAFHVTGLRARVSPMSGTIPALWQAFVPRLDEIRPVNEPGVSYGVMADFDPVAGQLDYMAAVSTPPEAAAPAGMLGWALPGGHFAVFSTCLADLGDAFGHIFGAWRAQVGEALLRAPYWERYGLDFSPDQPRSPVEIWMPVNEAFAQAAAQASDGRL